MRRIGLLGGMSWESTAVYYRLINEAVRERLGGLASADIVMRSLDFQAVVGLQKAGRWDAAADMLSQAACDLQQAGADCLLICTNTMHLVAPQASTACRLPLIHIIDETSQALLKAKCHRPLLLATRYTMEHGFYAERMARPGLDVVVPEARDRALCHSIIFDELCQGIVTSGGRQALYDMALRGRDAGADSVILGCTELGLSIAPGDLPLPGFDSTHIHAQAAVDFAFRGVAPVERTADLMAGAYI